MTGNAGNSNALGGTSGNPEAHKNSPFTASDAIIQFSNYPKRGPEFTLFHGLQFFHVMIR
jgi:hypothetical protein